MFLLSIDTKEPFCIENDNIREMIFLYFLLVFACFGELLIKPDVKIVGGTTADKNEWKFVVRFSVWNLRADPWNLEAKLGRPKETSFLFFEILFFATCFNWV